MTLLPPRGERALPVLAGVLLALAFPPAAFLLPSFVALAPLLLFIAERPTGPLGRWSATRGALVAGIVFFGLRLYWFVIALADVSPLAVPAYLLTVLVLAAVVAAFGWALHRLLEGLRPPLPLAAAVLWTAAEWVHGHLGPLSFPWLPLGSSLAPFPIIAGAADIGGVAGLSFWLAAVSGCVALLALRVRAGEPARTIGVVTALVAVVPAIYGWVRAETLELRPAARVAVVQPAVPTVVRRDTDRASDAARQALRRAMRGIGVSRGEGGGAGAGPGPELVVWPEVALPHLLETEDGARAEVRRLSAAAGAPILVGAYGTTVVGDEVRTHNSAFLVPAEGPMPFRYHKRVLVPFIERVPFGAGTLFPPDRPAYGALSPGGTATVHQVDGTAFGVLICFESAFPRLAREYRRRGADVLVSMTNDAWLGRDTWYGRTTALWQHPAHLVLRAIETRAGVVRAANLGFGMFVDPLGRVHGRIPPFRPGASTETVLTSDARTLSVRWGDWVGWGSIGVALIGVILAAGFGGMAGERGREIRGLSERRAPS